jgi:hypothetical protein
MLVARRRFRSCLRFSLSLLVAQAGMGRVGGEFWAKYYWNEKFQTVLERPTTTPEEAKQRSSDIHGLARLYVRSSFLTTLCMHCTLCMCSSIGVSHSLTVSHRFVDEAVPVVKQIVSEILLPDEDKAIKPVNVGGVAGGDKCVAFLSLVCAALAAVLTLRLFASFFLVRYMTKQLFIKFAKDDTTYHLYGGDDFAQYVVFFPLSNVSLFTWTRVLQATHWLLYRKAAGHELKSLNSLISCNVRSLHFPLMALANYLGYRVIVISKVRSFVARLTFQRPRDASVNVDTHTARVTLHLPAPHRKRDAQIR